ncbi:MAG: hypothetical protein RMM30_01750 [Armatimonadota bacterium]|nr:hypothetical protein [Armatimonadota bacterium]MDW8155297.1 hypothetical protein [Armatimonadota bacterium]
MRRDVRALAQAVKQRVPGPFRVLGVDGVAVRVRGKFVIRLSDSW